MEAFWGSLGLGVIIFLWYAGVAVQRWAEHRWPKQKC